MHRLLGTLLLGFWLSLLVPLFLVKTIYPRDLLLANASPQAQDFTYRSSVAEVRLLFFAADERNRSVEGLRSTDFAVVDDGAVIREFRSFAPAALVPLDVTVLIDASESVQSRFQQEMREVLELVAQGPWQSSDRLSVAAFSGMNANVLCDGNCRGTLTPERFAAIPTGGATPLFDALLEAGRGLAQRRQFADGPFDDVHSAVRPILILFSDGNDTISKASYEDAMTAIWSAETQIYAVDVSSSKRSSEGASVLRRLAEDSGGRWMASGQGSAELLRGLVDDLHSGFLVTYGLPQARSGFHSIRILPARNLNLRFRCRRGYFYIRSGGQREEGP